MIEIVDILKNKLINPHVLDDELNKSKSVPFLDAMQRSPASPFDGWLMVYI